MRILQTILFMILAYYALIYLWPLFLVLILFIIYQVFKARRLFRQSFQETEPEPDQKDYQTFRQDASGDVIDADYKERSDSDGPQ